MYYTIYTSSDNEEFNIYKNRVYNVITTGNEDNSCIICWTKNENHNLYYLKDYKGYTVSCDCNILIHFNCLDQWIQQTKSCPICRKKITINYLYLQLKSTNNNMIGYLNSDYYFKYILKLLRFACMISMINLFYIIIFNSYSAIYDLSNNYLL